MIDFKKNKKLSTFIKEITSHAQLLSTDRKKKLHEIAEIIRQELLEQKELALVFICTHNSRRSILGQVWGQIAAFHYNFDTIYTYSAGTVETSVSPTIINVLEKVGLKCTQKSTATNSIYQLTYLATEQPIELFSKKYTHPSIPHKFIAIMTCADAAENCPYIPQAMKRFSIPFEDPKYADNTPNSANVYYEKSIEIATEVFYLFSLL